MPSLVITLHLLEMVGDAVDLPGRILNGLGRAIGRLGRLVCGGLRLGRRLLGVLRSFLSLGGGGFSLLSLLLVMRRAPCKRDRKSNRHQH